MKPLSKLVRMALAVVVVLVFASSSAFASRSQATDRPGLDYETIELSAPNPDLCEAACKKDGKCRAWTYSWPGSKAPKALCALKTGVPPERSDTCCISGVLSTSSPVTRTDDPKPRPAQRTRPPAAKAEAPAAQEPEKAKAAQKDNQQQATVPPAMPARNEETGTRQQKAERPVASEQAESPRTAAKPRAKPTRRQEERDSSEMASRQPAEAPPLPDTDTGDAGRSTAQDPEKQADCREYALRAMEQNRQNNRLGCRLTGSRWGFDYDAYYDFCLRSPPSAYNSARTARDSELGSCKRSLASRSRPRDIVPEIDEPDVEIVIEDDDSSSFCRNFARQSVRQVRQARVADCRFGGDRWSDSRIDQARMCERIGELEATRILNERAGEIRRCVAGGQRDRSFADFEGGGFCESYARRSVEQARLARQMDCGYHGPRWQDDLGNHFEWCSRVSPRRTRREIRRRERMLYRCE